MKNKFDYEKIDGLQKNHIESLRTQAKEMYESINYNCPDSIEKSLSVTRLEECLFWANKSISHNKGE